MSSGVSMLWKMEEVFELLGASLSTMVSRVYVLACCSSPDHQEFTLSSKSQSLLYDFTTFTDKLWGQRLLLSKCCRLIHSPFLMWTAFPIWILACFQGRPEAVCPWLGVSMYRTASSDSACSCCTPSHGGAGKEMQRCAFSHFHICQGSFSSAYWWCSMLRNVQCPFHHTHTHTSDVTEASVPTGFKHSLEPFKF